jgi:hypothetical protein
MPDRNRKAIERRYGLTQDVLTMILLRWITVAAVVLGIAALASADETRASDLGADPRGAQRTAGKVRSGGEGPT